MKVKVNELLGKCDFNYTCDEFKNMSKSDTFFFCTIEEARYLQTMMYGIVAYDKEAFKVSSWLPMIKRHALNWNGSYYLHASQLSEREIGMFCRSNNGDKEWAGQLIKSNADIQLIKSQVMEDEMMFVAPKTDIANEWRIWMANGQPMACTKYHNEFCDYIENGGSDDGAVDFSIEIADRMYEPDERYVIDVAYTPDGYKVIEYNSYSTSGFYDVNPIELIHNTIESFKK